MGTMNMNHSSRNFSRVRMPRVVPAGEVNPSHRHRMLLARSAERHAVAAAVLAFLLVVGVSLASAATTGKLSGRVVDANNEPLPSANVLLLGTNLGGAADVDGYYTILNIPPGRYSVQFRMLGYRSTTVQNVEISVNKTTKLDAILQDESIQTADVVVTAQRPIVDVGLTSTVATVSDVDIRALPVQELNDIVNLQAGVVDGHFRGGREGEVQYQVNGVSVNNVFNNTSTVRIDRSLIKEVQVITGTFDAEYGQAMSGVVNTVLKSGTEKFEVTGEVYAGSYVYSSGGARGLDYKFRPATTQNYQFSLSGPTGLPQTYFLLNARRYVFDDYLYGRKLFMPTDMSNPDSLRLLRVHGSGNNAEAPLSYRREWSGLAKITNRSLATVEISYQALFNVLEGTPALSQGRGLDAVWNWRFNPEGMTKQKTKSIVHGLDVTHTLSSTTFYTVSFRQNYFDYTDWAYSDFYDPRYDRAGVPKVLSDYYYVYNGIPTNGAVLGGVDFTRYRQRTNSLLAKASVTSQVTRAHQVKIGAEFQSSKMEFGTPGILVYQTNDVGVSQLIRKLNDPPFFPGVQTYKPLNGAAYAQDQIEWNDLTIRAGVRAEYFNGRSYVPSDLANPANSIPGAPPSFAKRTTKKFTVAPRFGLSYPITERSSIFFSYGHFYQLPRLGDMYANADYNRLSLLQAGASDYGVLGNPDVKPEKTVQYEFGYKNAVTDFLGVSINLFYKDIRNLLGVQFVNTYTGAQYARLSNIDFGDVTGFTLSLEQRRIGLVSATVDYTWQMAQGNSSSPQETANLAQAGLDPRPRQVPFNWDQRHTLNVTVQLSEPENYSASAIMRYASGQPYTPSIGSGYGSQIEPNSGRKLSGFLADLRLEKYITIAQWNLSVFARVFNLFNADFFNGFVYSTTGSPEYTITPTDRSTINPTRYYPPRRIEVGVSLNSLF